MHIEHKHNLGREEAVRRVNVFAEEMMVHEPPAGVKISGVTRSWTGDRMDFSFTGKKGFFGATITGAVQAGDQVVTLDAELPGILTAFVSEDKIKGELQAQLARVFAA